METLGRNSSHKSNLNSKTTSFYNNKTMKLSASIFILVLLGVTTAQSQDTFDYCDAISCEGLYDVCRDECVHRVDENYLDACTSACEGVFDKCREACPDNNGESEDSTMSLRLMAISLGSMASDSHHQ